MTDRRGRAQKALREAKAKLEKIVCVLHPDKGVVLKSAHAPQHYNQEQECWEYENEYFTPLGQALIELYDTIVKGLEEATTTPAPESEKVVPDKRTQDPRDPRRPKP